jgi:ATP/maltotriose-dependent transcriptional regulator MalT
MDDETATEPILLSPQQLTAAEQATAAAAGRDWRAAYDALAPIEQRTASETEDLAEAAWWLGSMDESIQLYTDANRMYLEADDLSSASRTAVLLSIHTRLVGDAAQSAGWSSRAVRHLESVPESPDHGYPLYLQIAAHMGQGDSDAALADARRMQELGRRYDDPTLQVLGVYFEGRVLIKQAKVKQGLSLLDEAMVAALSDQLGQLWTGAIYCGLMDVCNELRDPRRAFEWTEATRRWTDPLPLASVFPGICRVHRAQVMQTRGEWAAAEAEALGASVDLVGIDVFAVADAYYEVGEVRRMRGDLKGAEEAYTAAHDHGRDPQPGLALLRLSQGRVQPAAASIAAALATPKSSRLDATPLLAAQVMIAIAAGDLERADESAAELEDIARTFDSQGICAEAYRSTGAVRIAQGRHMEALGSLRSAMTMFQELDAPFDVARCRILLADCYRELGDTDGAEREQAAAQQQFDKLGVVSGRSEYPNGLTAREVEVIELIAAGMSNREIAESLVLSQKTVARHLSNIFVKVGAANRSAVTAFAYDSGLMGRTTQS